MRSTKPRGNNWEIPDRQVADLIKKVDNIFEEVAKCCHPLVICRVQLTGVPPLRSVRSIFNFFHLMTSC